ncbi:MAG: ABC transporter ATP-binding protein [candidate division WOR-3 bacterium]
MREIKKFFSTFKNLVWKNNSFRFSVFVLFTLLSVFFATITSFLVKEIVDKGVINKDFNFLFRFGFLTLFSWMISILLGFFSTITLRYLRNRVEIKLRVNLLKNFYSLDYEFISKRPSGYFLSRIHDEPDSIITSLLTTTSGIVLNLFWSILGFSIGFLIAPQLCIFIIPFFLINTFLNYFFGGKYKIFIKERDEKSALLQGFLNNLIENYKLIKIFEIINHAEKKFKLKLKEFLQFLTKVTFFTASINNIQAFLQMIMQIGLLIFAGYEILNGRLTIGSYLGFSTILWQLISAVENLYNSIINIRECTGEIERMEELSPSPYKVSFNFSNNKKIVFKNVEVSLLDKKIKYPDFEIPEGKRVLILGENGSGKTTLLYTLCGLYSFNGEISLFSKNISISFAPPLLMDGNIYENLEIISGCKKEEIDYYLDIFNLNHLKTKNVNLLSAGERKKIDIIRCFLKKSDIYLFDEPFTNVDENGKEKFLETMGKFKDKTFIITSPSQFETLNQFFDIIIKIKKEEQNEGNK